VDASKLNKVVEAAKMYYQLDYSQQDIAKKLGVSRPSVSRLLQLAKQQGIVQIKILDPTEDVQKLANLLKSKFDLKDCLVASIPIYEDEVIKELLGEVAADYLYEIVQDGDVIGTTWGTTLYQVAQRIKPKNVKGVSVVQLNGGVSHSETNTYASDILNYLSKAFNTMPHFLPLPAVVDHVLVKQAIMADRHIRRVLELGKQANIAMYTVGEPNHNSTLVRADYFSKEDLEILSDRKAVGDICSRYFDATGSICHKDLDARTIGIELAELPKKNYGILIAGGGEKVEGIYGALQGKYANVLITDQITAKSLLELESSK
jgi:deoxyribonucleoside regulator